MKPWEMTYSTAEVKANNQNIMPWEMDYSQPDFSKAKPNNIFSTDGLNTNAPQRADSWWQSVKNAYNEHMNEHWAEVDRRTKEREKAVENALTFGETVGKSAASAFVDLYGSAGSMINWFGDNMIISDENAELLGLEKKTQDRLNTFGKVWQTVGSSIKAFADYTKSSELKLDDKIFEGEIWENPSANRFGALYGSVVPSMVSMAGLSKLTGSKAFTYITMGGLSSGEIYEEAKKKGLDLERTNLLYTSSWASQSILERLFDPIANVFDAKVLGNSIPKQIAKRVFSGMMESGTEFSQTLSQNAIKKYGGIDETQDLMEGVIESMIGGFIGGGVFSGAFNERNQALLDKGMSQDEINAVIDEARRYVSGHADEINDFAYQKITEGLSTFEQFIKDNLGTPEAQKAIQTKKDLEFVGEQVYDMLKKAGRTEESARKESQIVQGISLWGAEETGLSPIEFIKQRFPEVRQAKFKEFQEQFATKKEKADLKNINLFEAVLNPKMREEIAKAEKAERGLSLIQFIKQRGGLKDVDGDLKAMDAGKLQVGLINNKGGNELDDIALAAWENGYFPDKMERPDIDELKTAIRDELFGEKKYAYQQGKESVIKDIEELEAALDMLDIDYSNMSASELEAVYNEAVNEYNAENKVTFEEDEYIDDEDYIPFQGSESGSVVDLSSLFDGMKNLTVKQVQDKITEEFKKLLGKPLKTGTPPYKLQLVKDKYLHVIDNGVKMTPAQNKRKLSTLSVVEDIVSSAVKIDKDGTVDLNHNKGKNLKRKTNTVEEYIYFESPVVFKDSDGNSKYYTVELATEKIKDQADDLLDLYNVRLKASPVKNVKSTLNATDRMPSNTIISQTDSGVKPQFQGGEKDLVVTHATTLEKLQAALELGAMPMPSLAVSKASLSGSNNFGEILFVGGSRVIDPNSKKENKTFTADIYSTRRVAPVYEINKDGQEYIKRQTNNISKQGLNYWVSNISSDLEREVDYHLKELYLASIGKITNLDDGTYKIVNDMTDKQKSDFMVWKRKFILEYTDKKIFEGYTPSGNRKYSPYDLKNVLRIMQKQNLKGSESTASGNAHALRGVWAEELKSIDAIRGAKDKLVDEETYQKMDNVIWDETTKLSDLLVSESKAEELEQSWIAPDEYMIEDALKKIKPSSNISKILNDAGLRSDKKAVDAVKKYMQLVKDLPVRYFESKPQRAVDFSEFYGVIIPKDSQYDSVAMDMEDYGLKVIRSDNPSSSINEFQDVFFQNANDPRGAYYKDIIYLFEKANASTFMHETAHWFKEELKKFGSEKSAMMLKKVEEWENEEFVKRYSVALDKGRYVVKNKVGGIVYDQAFQTEEDAKDYAKNELFARGFEAYLKEGKAPNSYLKNAFKSFWNWLRQLYRSAKTLNVELNDNIRGVYSNILGGMDLDFYLNAPTLEAIQHRQVMSKQREEYILDTIKEAQAMERNRTRLPFANFRQERAESKKDGVSFWGKAMIPISTRAKRVSPKLRNKLREYDFNVLQEQKRQYEQILPFYDKWKLMSQDDIVAFDLALKNGFGKMQDELVRKYDADKEFKAVRDLLEEIYERAEGVGIDMGHQRDYFPREIADLDGFMAYLHGSEMASDFRRAAKEAGFREMTDEEKASFINKYLRGYNRLDLVAPQPGNVKDRRIDVIDAEINQFYKPSSQALFSYIDRMSNAIESRKFFGKDEERIEDSIGAFIDEMIENGEIRASQDKEVEDILKARFKQKGVSNKFLTYQRNISYLYTMGGINSAITQLSDLSVAMYKGGVWNTAKAIFGPKAPELTREGLGLEKIGQEFVDASTSSKAVEKIFKLTGLDKIDAFGKNILMQASYLKFKDMAKNNPAKLKELIEPIMEQKTAETVADLAEGKITFNVKFLMYNELADVQPITLSEMPEGYLVGGNYRSLYMLKTFMVKRIDTFRNECFDKIRSGQPEEVKKGLQNLFSLAMLMMLCGAAKDAIIDLLYGRKINLKDMVVNNALGLFGITKYQLYKARDDGFGGFMSSFIPPVFAVWSDLGRDMSDDFLTAKGKDLKDYEVLKGIPLVGRFYYWWFGGGRTKEEKKKKKKLK